MFLLYRFGRSVAAVLLSPEFSLHLQLDVLEVDASVHRLHVTLGHVIWRRLPVAAVREIRQFLPGKGRKYELHLYSPTARINSLKHSAVKKKIGRSKKFNTASTGHDVRRQNTPTLETQVFFKNLFGLVGSGGVGACCHALGFVTGFFLLDTPNSKQLRWGLMNASLFRFPHSWGLNIHN